MLVICAVLCFTIYLIYQKWKKRDLLAMERQLNSGIFRMPFVGHGYMFLGNGETRMKAFQRLGRDALRNSNGLTAIRHGPYFYTVVADPTAAEVILKTCLEKDDLLMKIAKNHTGNGSIFAPVPIWRLRRKVLIPSFGTKNLKHFVSIFSKQSSILMKQLKPVASKGTTSIFNFFTSYTMDSIAEASLGYKMNAQLDGNHPFLQAFDTALKILSRRLCQPWLQFDFIYKKLPDYRQLFKDKEYLWNFITELIQSKREEMKKKKENNNSIPNAEEDGLKCFLELLIDSSGGENGYTNEEVIEEVIVIMIAGNDTTAVAASFVCMMLARHPEIQDKIYEELREVFGDSNRPASADDLLQLKYLDAVIRETLRLYPPVPIIARKVEKEVNLSCGIKLVPNSGVVVNIWALHRNQQYWGEDAEEFRPERFLDIQLKHPAAFIPFSHGPRNCVGYQFAMTSMKMMLSIFLRQYKILPSKPTSGSTKHFRLRYDLMMKDVDNFPLEIELRA